ncbi:hypothetical protein [Novosphingobium rosa]|uniref:hypothetical protein n=1 Tax=Novosphingobium rosa TaxID=76978 RepID=UPI000835DEF2|nr:hypothetical protein [Novosphingobium rosa]
MSALLSLAILLLFALVLLELGVVGPGSGPGQGHLVSLSMSQEKNEQKKTPEQKQKTEVTHAVTAAVRPPAPLQKPEEAPPPPPAPVTPGFIHMSHDEMASSDISKMPKSAGGGGGGGGGGGSGGGQGAGTGPGGAVLYNAKWYREPTEAETRTYIKPSVPPGAWATIACRTVEHFHVEDCEILDENPRGTGLGHQLQQAAWQFLVWPPRINGKPQVGEWVRIRFDISRRGGNDSDGQ